MATTYHYASGLLTLYHGAHESLPPGTVLRPHDMGWEHLDPMYSDQEEALERFRPPDALARDACVFLAATPEDTRTAGGGPVVHSVRPEGEPQASDLGWYGRFARAWTAAENALIDAGVDWDGFDGLWSAIRPEDMARLREFADGYWSGRPHPGASLTEYRARSATVVAEV